MRITKYFGNTLRETSAELVSHNLLLRAGYIRQLSSGIFSYLNPGLRCIRKIERILREEIDAINGVEISMPIVQAADLWKQTGRYDSIDESLVRFNDRNKRDMVLAMTHEEAVTDLAKSEIMSYKQLPSLVYQIQTKFRDEARPRGGLVRVKEFIMKDSYSFDKDWEGMEKQYQAHYEAYFKIAARVGLPVIDVKSDAGMMGGKVAHEFMYVSPAGEDTLFICPNCGYKANKEIAAFKKQAISEAPEELKKVHTPGTTSIESLAGFLNISKEKTGKMVFYTSEKSGSEKKLIIALVRGDMDVNEVKVKNICKAENLRPSTTDEITAIGAVAGYASPIGIKKENVTVIADDLVTESNNLVVGANEADYHFTGSCYGRDYQADIVADIVSAEAGRDCRDCGKPLDTVRGIEVGNIFQLGTKYSESIGAFFTDEDGKSKPVIMGSYGIGLGRLLACIAEEHNDQDGLKLPVSISPFQVHLTLLADSPEIIETAERVYNTCLQAGIEILFDDRDKVSPGSKFKDADLIGIPIRLTVSRKSVQNGGIELKLRGSSEKEIVPESDILNVIIEKLDMLYSALSSGKGER
jgi:prolyl-tRNA synthetase